jgi:hypothetical protein
MTDLRSMIPYLIPVLILELILLFVALRDLRSRANTNGPKGVWVMIIVFVQIVGPILYFVFGRRDE